MLLTMSILIKELLPSLPREAVIREPEVKFRSAYITLSEFTVLQLPRTYPSLDFHPFKLCFSLNVIPKVPIPYQDTLCCYPLNPYDTRIPGKSCVKPYRLGSRTASRSPSRVTLPHVGVDDSPCATKPQGPDSRSVVSVKLVMLFVSDCDTSPALNVGSLIPG